MANTMRGTAGKFAPKSDVPRKIRSVNLSDAAWNWLADTAERTGMSRNDFLEALANGSMPFMEKVSEGEDKPFIEMVEGENQPFMEKVELPEPATLLNQLKARRKNSKVTLADVETILEMLPTPNTELPASPPPTNELRQKEEEIKALKKKLAESEEYAMLQQQRVSELTRQLRELEKKVGLRRR